MNLVASENYNTTLCEFYEDGHDEVWLTREQIGSALGYADPAKSIQNIHLKHKDRLDKFIKRERAKTSDLLDHHQPDGARKNGSTKPFSNLQSEVVYYSERGVMEICRWSDMPKADEFMDWVWDIVEAYRHKELIAQKDTMLKLVDRVEQLGQRVNSFQESQKRIEETAATALAGLNSLNSGVITAFSRPVEWINEIMVELKKYAEVRPMMTVEKCIEWIIDSIEQAHSAPNTFREYKNRYLLEHPGAKVTRLAVVAEDSQYRAIFTEMLRRELLNYNEDFEQGSSLITWEIPMMGDPVEGGKKEWEPDWDDPALIEALEMNKKIKERWDASEKLRREAMKKNPDAFGDFDDIVD